MARNVGLYLMQVIVMDRNTLAWYRCNICGRKGAVYECSLRGEKLLLCPNCALILRATCRGLRFLQARTTVKVRRVEADDLLSRVETGLKKRRR